MTKPKSEYCIQTVDNALRLLEAFERNPIYGVSELSRDMDLHKNNVFRLLATLQSRGYIEQCSENGEYRLGPGCLRLGRSFARSQDVVQRARVVLERLVAEIGEVAHLAILRDFDVFHLDAEAPERMLQCATRVGESLPVHATALGKILVGCNDEATRRDYSETMLSGKLALPARSEHTITDPHKLAAHLQAVGVAGYATDLEESEVGLHCAAVPVHDADDRVIAALSISGPAFRLSEDDLQGRVRSLMVDAGEGLSRSLGWQG